MNVPEAPIQPVVVNIAVAAQYLEVSPDTVRRLIRSGAIPHARIGHSIRIRRVDLDSYVTDQVSRKWRRFDGRGRRNVPTELQDD